MQILAEPFNFFKVQMLQLLLCEGATIKLTLSPNWGEVTSFAAYGPPLWHTIPLSEAYKDVFKRELAA